MKNKIATSFLFLLLFCSTYPHTALSGPIGIPSSEYRVGLYQDLILDINRITHIILVGSAVYEDSDQFFQSGLTRAQRYKELYPDHQVVIISSPDVLNTPDEEVFRKYNVVVAKKVMEKINAKAFLRELEEYSQIASLDFFGHSSPWAMKIGATNASFSPDEHFETLKNLRSNFLPNAYVTLNACNTGYSISPDLSAALRLPVSGALTSSMFEKIGADGLWYKEEDWIKGNYTDINKYSFNQPFICATGLCNRMKPSRWNYNSIWGKFKEGGLSFNKFFCNFNNSDDRCEKGMANSLLAFPSVVPITVNSSYSDFKKVVDDWLCSTANDRNFFKQCTAGIEEAISRYDLVFKGHPINELMCDFKSCHAKVICDNDPEGTPIYGTCHVKTPLNPEPTNLAREYLSFMKGYEKLQQYHRQYSAKINSGKK
ncbi:MAG: hypothetical protein WC635_10310 [Bacteriovorax sp.]|jgi:hypothetical protein